MGIHRLNHAVLFVRDLGRSVAFYRDVLGFEVLDARSILPGAAFLRAADSTNDHDLGLFELGPGAHPAGAEQRAARLYHLAWEVNTLTDLQRLAGALQTAGALTGASDHGTTKSLYGADPDGLEFEIVWIVPAALLDDAARENAARVRHLDLPHEIARYGAETPGGIGVSRSLAHA